MLGERLSSAKVKEYGFFGDRAFALVDNSDGKVATAKNPRKWPNLFAFRATYMEPPSGGSKTPLVLITLPDNSTVISDQNDVDQTLTKALHREVTLASTENGHVTAVHSSMPDAWTAKSEEYWPDIQGLEHRDVVTDFALPTGTFFDCATIHLLTTATLRRLQEFYPQGRFEVERFRPNIVVESSRSESVFPENEWIGHTVAIGDEVRLNITAPCGRCVMTTLPQGDLPRDHGILRTVVQKNQAKVGVYAVVLRGGTIRCEDAIRLIS
jgi:uncharacterized protein YcbX